jgi:hypothetical protein
MKLRSFMLLRQAGVLIAFMRDLVSRSSERDQGGSVLLDAASGN